MKIKDWIIFGVFALVASASTSLGAESAKTVQENFTQLESALQNAKDQIAGSGQAQTFHWAELENFQTLLWRAMALDPSTVAPVPVNQVPKNLFSAELNSELDQKFAELKKSPHPKEFHAEPEFAQYVATVDHILLQRRSRQFPQARATAKRGALDQVYQPLAKKMTGETEGGGLSVPAIAQIEENVHSLKTQMDVPSAKEAAKKEVFANGNRFIWMMMVAMVGFFMGIAGYRMNPDFFQKVLDQFHSNTPTATTHSVGVKLDYARWLRELEEILSRLKSSQMTLERRIEDIVQNSEKISQHSLSLYADPRIKNEANLEYRMSTLLREVQQQFDQSQRLRSGDRVQVNVMLEHCLKLCDAIETDTIHYDRTKTAEVPGNTRSA